MKQALVPSTVFMQKTGGIFLFYGHSGNAFVIVNENAAVCNPMDHTTIYKFKFQRENAHILQMTFHYDNEGNFEQSYH